MLVGLLQSTKRSLQSKARMKMRRAAKARQKLAAEDRRNTESLVLDGLAGLIRLSMVEEVKTEDCTSPRGSLERGSLLPADPD